MLRIVTIATLLLLAPATEARADSATASDAAAGEGITIQLQIGAGVGAQAIAQPAVRAILPSAAMQRTINGVARAQRTAAGRNAMLGLFNRAGDRPGLALPVSESISLGLRYQYLRPEDIRRGIAETASLDDGYSSHNLVVRARWRF